MKTYHKKKAETSSESSQELSDPSGDDWGAKSNSEGENEEVGDYETGDFVIVKYCETFYPGQILQVFGEKSAKVKTMEKKGLTSFRWPDKEDYLTYKKEDIINVPNLCNSRGW